MKFFSIVLRIEKKRFDYVDAATFVTKWDQYRDDDTEPKEFNLKEMQIKFPPTYVIFFMLKIAFLKIFGTFKFEIFALKLNMKFSK